MNLDIETWGDFKIADLFPVLQNGKANQGMLSDGNECFYVGAKKDNNGVMLHCAYDADLIQKGNCIIFICDGQGSVGYANYMDADFAGTPNIVAGYNDNLNMYNGLFIATILCKERPKYSFGRKWKNYLSNTVIKLPQTQEGNPDWTCMEQYIKSLNCKPVSTKNQTGNGAILHVYKWKPFCIGRLFKVYTGGDLILTDAEEGTIPVASHKADNNGIGALVNTIAGQQLFDSNKTIALADRGCFHASVQTKDFYIGTRVKALVIKPNVKKEVLFFIATIINMETFKYNYGRNCTSGVEDVVIYLPVLQKSDGNIFIDETHLYSDDGYVPDWVFMGDYIKSLPYGDRI